MLQHKLRCETCEFFIAGMRNYFGADQPFCRNPVVIEYHKNQPKDPGRSEDGKRVWLPMDVVMEGDMWYHPMNGGEVTIRRILGCASHSSLNGPSEQEIREEVLDEMVEHLGPGPNGREIRDKVLGEMVQRLDDSSNFDLDCNTTDEWYGHGWDDCRDNLINFVKELRKQSEKP
jgi:hypothetical protein